MNRRIWVLCTAGLVVIIAIAVIFLSGRENALRLARPSIDSSEAMSTVSRRQDSAGDAELLDGNGSQSSDEVWKPTEAEKQKIEGTRMVFYGIVLDQRGDPVPEAEVVCLPNGDPWTGGAHRVVVKSSAKGTFTLSEENTPSAVITVKCPGYYTTEKSGGRFGFSELAPSAPEALKRKAVGPMKTTEEHPHVFVLSKKGETDGLLKREHMSLLKNEQAIPIGMGDMQKILVRYDMNQHDHSKNTFGRTVYDWNAEIVVPGGGVVAVETPIPSNPESFVAPEKGYQESVEWVFTRTMSEDIYKREFRQTIFVKFSDKTFARIEVEFISDPKKSRCRVVSWYNPTGRRFTEFDSAKEIIK